LRRPPRWHALTRASSSVELRKRATWTRTMTKPSAATSGRAPQERVVSAVARAKHEQCERTPRSRPALANDRRAAQRLVLVSLRRAPALISSTEHRWKARRISLSRALLRAGPNRARHPGACRRRGRRSSRPAAFQEAASIAAAADSVALPSPIIPQIHRRSRRQRRMSTSWPSSALSSVQCHHRRPSDSRSSNVSPNR